MKAVLSIFSPIVCISPPLGQMSPNMERDVKDIVQKYPKIRGNASIVNRENGWKMSVFGCSNSRNEEKGISMHKIPSDNDPRPFLTSQLRMLNIGRFSLARS